MELRKINKKARFAPFWIMLAIFGILLLGAFITPIKIMLDDIFLRFETNATANGDSKLGCSDADAYWYIKSTCFVLGGTLVLFILYVLYTWLTAMVNGAKSPDAIFAPKLKQMQRDLED